MIQSRRGMTAGQDKQRVGCQTMKADQLLAKSMTGVRRETAVFGQMKQPENIVAANPGIEQAEN